MQDWVGKAKQCKEVVDKAVRVFRGPSQAQLGKAMSVIRGRGNASKVKKKAAGKSSWGLSEQGNAKQWNGRKGKGRTWMGQEGKGKASQEWQGNDKLGSNGKEMQMRYGPGNARPLEESSWHINSRGTWSWNIMQGKGVLAGQDK